MICFEKQQIYRQCIEQNTKARASGRYGFAFPGARSSGRPGIASQMQFPGASLVTPIGVLFFNCIPGACYSNAIGMQFPKIACPGARHINFNKK